MAATDPPSIKVLAALHDWQRQAGLPLTYPATMCEAWIQQWAIIRSLSRSAAA